MSDALELGKKRAKEIGLSAYAYGTYYPAEIIHRLLGEGVELFTDARCIAPNQLKTSMCTHTAIMIAIRPVAKPDTAESLVKEFVESWFEKDIRGNLFSDIAERAKAFLAKGEK